MVAASPAHHGSPVQGLSESQVQSLMILERTGGSISIVSVLLIFFTYWLIPKVRNVQNTFIVFASVSNVGASIACIIAFDGLKKAHASALCQAQSFMFEMFMQSDPWWALAMAVNVFLVFFFRTSPDAFKKWWWVYCLICYGGPFIIALTLLLIRKNGKGPIYGDAGIWCWVDNSWDEIRIYTYYMLIWICIAGSLICYFLVGYHVFHTRNQLRSLHTPPKSRKESIPASPPSSSLPEDGFYGTVRTDIQVAFTRRMSNPTPIPNSHSISESSSSDGSSSNNNKHGKKHGLQVMESGLAKHISHVPASREFPAGTNAGQYTSIVTSEPPRRSDTITATTSAGNTLERSTSAARSFVGKFVVEDPIKAAYLRTSLLFGISVLVTWIPSSLNRIHSWLTGSSPFEYSAASAAVLPLQGLWNAVIFFITSWKSIRSWVRTKRESKSEGNSRSQGQGAAETRFQGQRSATLARDQWERSMGHSSDRHRIAGDISLNSSTDFAYSNEGESQVELGNVVARG